MHGDAPEFPSAGNEILKGRTYICAPATDCFKVTV